MPYKDTLECIFIRLFLIVLLFSDSSNLITVIITKYNV